MRSSGELEVNAIFKRFREDFEKGHKGCVRIENLFAKYGRQLSDKPDEQAQLRAKALALTDLDCDWSLNALGR